MDINVFRKRATATVQSLSGQADNGDTLAGTPSLAQWAVTQLFSRRNGTPFRLAEGTTLTTALTSGRLLSDTDVYAAFSAAAARVLATASRLETADTPPAERLKALTLTRLTLTPGKVTFAVAVKARDATPAHTVTVDFDLTAA